MVTYFCLNICWKFHYMNVTYFETHSLYTDLYFSRDEADATPPRPYFIIKHLHWSETACMSVVIGLL